MTSSSTSSSEPIDDAPTSATSLGSRVDDSAISVLIGVIICILVAALRPDVPAARNPEWYWMMKLDRDEPVAMVIGGDSRVYRGIDPTTIGERLGESVFNAGFSSAKYRREYLAYLRRLVSEDPGAIVIGLSPFSFGSRAMTGFEQAVEMNRRRRLPIRMIRAFDQIPRGFAAIDPGVLLGRDAVMPSDEDYRQVFHDSGWVESDRPDAHQVDAWKTSIRKVADDYPTDPAQIDELMAAVAEWHAEGIEVFAFTTPVEEEILRFELDLFDISLESTRARFEAAGGVWLDLDSESDLRWYDVSHLDGDSAQRFSLRLAEAILASRQTAGASPE